MMLHTVQGPRLESEKAAGTDSLLSSILFLRFSLPLGTSGTGLMAAEAQQQAGEIPQQHSSI